MAVGQLACVAAEYVRVTVWQRWILVQGCVAPIFPIGPFMAALRKVPDVELVIDETTAHPEQSVPYTRIRNAASPQGGMNADSADSSVPSTR
jgi:hypothetical protein